MVSPWRLTKGVEPCAMKVASTVLNGEDEETDRKALRLVLTQPRCSPHLMRSVAMTSNVKSRLPMFLHFLCPRSLRPVEEPEPVRHDG